MKYICSICGYSMTRPWAIPTTASPPAPSGEDLPDDFACPLCGVGKDQFEQA